MGDSRTASRYSGAAVTEGGAGGSARRRVSRPVSAERFEPAAPPDAETPERSTVVRSEAEGGERGDYPPDLVFIVDDAGQVLYVNRPLGALTEDDVIGSEIYDWIFPEQHALIRDCLDRVAATGAPAGCEIPGIQHYDADAWYECRVTPNLRDGRIVSVTIIARDITRHKRAQQRMRTRLVELERLVEERDADLHQTRQSLEAQAAATGSDDGARTDRWFRALLDAAGEAVFVSDRRSGRVIDVNETGCRWLRRSRDQVLGRTAAELDLEFPISPPEDADLAFTETRDTRRPLMLSGVHRRRDGSSFPVEVAVARHEISDEQLVLAVVRDVKGRQKTQDALHAQEARYRALLEQSWDAVYVTTRAGVIVEANPAAYALFGAAPEELAGLDARALIPAPEDIRRWQRAMAERGVVERIEVEFHRRDGTAFRGLLSAARLYDRDGHISGYHCLVRAHTPAEPVPARPARPARAGHPDVSGPAAAAHPPVPRTRGTVLIVDANPERAVTIGEALHGAGYQIVAERDPGRAAEHFREPDPALRAVVVGLDGEGAAGEWALRAIRGLDATIPLVAVIGNGRAAEAVARLDDVELLATLPAPVHPLALAQALRELPAPSVTP